MTKTIHHACPNCGHFLNEKPLDIELTERQKSVISLVAQGLTAKEIGERLKISQRTVEFHRIMIQEKTGAQNLAGIIRFALTHNLV